MLARNPKYVFASIPQACHHPILREWTRQFYGFSHSREKRERALEHNSLEWNYLTTAMPKRKTISNRDAFPGKTFLTYNCRNTLRDISKLLKDSYNEDFKRELMDINRVYWNSLSPVLCRPRIRDIFYAYFPSHDRDILNFRPYDKGQTRKMSIKY